jgi:hypothetical protein
VAGTDGADLTEDFPVRGEAAKPMTANDTAAQQSASVNKPRKEKKPDFEIRSVFISWLSRR